MKSGLCISGCNNVNYESPPLMSDGRNFANWNQSSVINQNIINEANIKTNTEYRNYLIKNADDIIKLINMKHVIIVDRVHILIIIKKCQIIHIYLHHFYQMINQ